MISHGWKQTIWLPILMDRVKIMKGDIRVKRFSHLEKAEIEG